MTLWRRTSFALALASGLGLSQAPEFAQQYRQRLGGALDELQSSLAAFDADTRAEGLTREEGAARLAQSSDPLARQRGDRIVLDTARLARLRRQAESLRNDAPLALVVGMASDPDWRVMRGAYDDFKPALQLTSDGAISAGGGFLGGLALLRLLGLPFRRHGLNSRKALASASPPR